jgi:hypothetical protein
MRALLLLLVTCVASPAATYYVTVAGLGGEPDYEQRFAGWAREAEQLLRGSGNEQVVTLSGAEARRENLKTRLDEIAAKAQPEDALVLMMIGHGTYDGAEYKFNLPGRDVTAAELAQWLDRVPASRQLVVNMTSASGGSLPALSRKNRVVVTATRTGTEKNATVFARYWVEALRDPTADVDKNEVVSALEAFRFADARTRKFYETQKRLATEHALLDDKGAGEGVRAPGPENGHGMLASNFTVVRFGAAQTAAATPAKRKLLARKEQLEQDIDRLKYQKAAMPSDEYRRKMQALLLELARVQAEIDQ